MGAGCAGGVVASIAAFQPRLNNVTSIESQPRSGFLLGVIFVPSPDHVANYKNENCHKKKIGNTVIRATHVFSLFSTDCTGAGCAERACLMAVMALRAFSILPAGAKPLPFTSVSNASSAKASASSFVCVMPPPSQALGPF
jgi:hypothetical protein